MAEPTTVVLIRFKTSLSLEEVEAVVESRIGEFRALAGLRQKYYLQDAETGEYAGLYLWDSPESLATYQESEFRKSIAAAYQVEGAPRIEVYRVVKALREEGV